MGPWYAPGLMRFVVGWMIACVALGAGCSSETIFQCQTDEQCVSGGGTGVCQPNGYCSLVDANCETGVRYADSAPPGLAGQCVEPEQDGSTGATSSQPSTMSTTVSPSGGESTGTTTGNTTASSSTRGSSAGTDSTFGSTQGEDSTSTGGSSSSAGSSSDSSSATSGPTCPEFVDEFDNGVVGEPPWTEFSGADPILSESGGRLRFAVAPGTAVFEFIQMSAVDISDGYAVAHLVSLPQDDAGQFLLRVFPGGAAVPPDAAVELVLTSNTELVARVDGDLLQFVDLGVAATELWLEVYFNAGIASFAYSVDGNDFAFIGSSAVMGDYSVADVSLMGGSFEPTTAPMHFIEVDDFEFCTQPFD